MSRSPQVTPSLLLQPRISKSCQASRPLACATRERLPPRRHCHSLQPTGPVRTARGGILSAWDPALQKERWFAPAGGQSGGGVISTASNLVFQVTPQGRPDRLYRRMQV
jgi:hypothetical protein